MNRIKLFVLIISLITNQRFANCQIPDKNAIFYYLPDDVNRVLLKELEVNKKWYDTTKFIPSILIEKDCDTVFCYLLNGRRLSEKGYKLDSLVFRTNRFAKLNNDIYLPIIFDSDLKFSQFAHGLLGTFFCILFDFNSGKVYRWGI